MTLFYNKCNCAACCNYSLVKSSNKTGDLLSVLQQYLKPDEAFGLKMHFYTTYNDAARIPQSPYAIIIPVYSITVT
jgi:hypothetical protein